MLLSHPYETEHKNRRGLSGTGIAMAIACRLLANGDMEGAIRFTGIASDLMSITDRLLDVRTILNLEK